MHKRKTFRVGGKNEKGREIPGVMKDQEEKKGKRSIATRIKGKKTRRRRRLREGTADEKERDSFGEEKGRGIPGKIHIKNPKKNTDQLWSGNQNLDWVILKGISKKRKRTVTKMPLLSRDRREISLEGEVASSMEAMGSWRQCSEDTNCMHKEVGSR